MEELSPERGVAGLAETLAALDTTPGEWLYRPDKHDDWGVIRGAVNEHGWRSFIMQVNDPRFRGEECLAEHRRNKTDPWEGNARFIALCLTYRDQIIAALTTQAKAREPGSEREALRAMTLLDEDLEAEHPGWMTGTPSCPLCDGTGHKDHAGFAMDTCDHKGGE